MPLVTLYEGRFGTYEVVPVSERNKDLNMFIQSDWDRPGLANMFGWVPRMGRGKCRHYHTDGTVDCPDCGRTAGEFIEEATRYLDRNIGKTIRV